MKAFIFRSAVESVRYEVFETIINMISPLGTLRSQNVLLVYLFVWRDEFIVFILDVHTVDIANYVLSARFKNKRGMLCIYAFNIR